MHGSMQLAGAAPLQRAALKAPAAARAARRAAARVPPAAFFNRGGSAAAGGNDSAGVHATEAQETMVPDGAIKSLSPEARRIFREAQDNIIELNRSRLRALEELKAARQKIAELEEKLESAVAEASSATAQLQQLGPASSQQAAAAAAAMAPPATFGQQQAAAPPQQGVPAAEQGVTVVYETGWGSAFLHYNCDGRGWTEVPGARMDNGSQQFPGKKVLTVPGRRLEFVINDGKNDWDKPQGKDNYVVEEPGTYRVKGGKLTRLA